MTSKKSAARGQGISLLTTKPHVSSLSLTSLVVSYVYITRKRRVFLPDHMHPMLIQCIGIVEEEGNSGHMGGKKESFIIFLKLQSPDGDNVQDEERGGGDPYFSLSKSGVSSLLIGKPSIPL